MGFFSLIAKLGLDTTSFEAGVKRAEGVAQQSGTNIGKSFTSAGTPVLALSSAFAAGAIGIGMWINNAGRAAAEIGKLAEQTGLTNQEIQNLTILANKSGVELTAYQRLLLSIGEARDKANAGDSESQFGFDRFHVSDEILKSNKSNLESALLMSAELKKQEQSMAAQADAVALVGKRGLGALNSIGDYRNETNNTISDEDIKYARILENEKAELARRSNAAGAPYAATAGRRARGLRRLLDAPDEDIVFLADKMRAQKLIDEFDKTNRPPTQWRMIDHGAAPREKTAKEKAADEAFDQTTAASEYENVLKYRKLQKDRDRALTSSQYGFDSAASGGLHYFGADTTASLGGAVKENSDKLNDLTEQIKGVRSQLGNLANE